MVRTTRFTEEDVREQAHAIWDAHGRPEGRDVKNWLDAETELLKLEEVLVSLNQIDAIKATICKAEDNTIFAPLTIQAMGEEHSVSHRDQLIGQARWWQRLFRWRL